MFIKWFRELGKEDVSIAGGKGASLGEMTKAKIPIPNGFVVLSEAFKKFIQETDLNVEIDAVLDTVNPDEMHTIENASEKIQAMIIGSETPKDIKEEIEKTFKKLNSKFVAVRSSATAEDSANAAWAGQLDSYLNTTKKDLLENIKKCWVSLFTPRAIFYRFEKKLNGTDISVAVVVQKMINSEKSGIAFSVHPVTQDPNQIIIEAGFGLGEAIVQGSITPDSYVVDKQDWHIIDINVNEQTKGLFRKANGGNEWKELGNKGKKQVLNEKEIIELAKLIVKIEKHYGFPIDVEFAVEDNKIYIVQSRPITTLIKIAEKKVVQQGILARRFLEQIKSQDLYPPLHGVSIFVESSDWGNKKYFEPYYDDKAPFPILTIMKGEKGTSFLPMQIKNLSSEFFTKYWKNPFILKERIRQYKKENKKLEILYKKLSYKYIKNNSEKIVLKEMKKIVYHFSRANAILCFSIIFDKPFCFDLLKNLKVNISEQRLNELWDKAIIPNFNSFERKQKQKLFRRYLIEKNIDLLTEEFQYFFTGYYNILPFKEAKKKTIKELKNLSKEKTQENLKIYGKELKSKKENYNKWFLTLSPDEKKLVNYVQNVMELRDDRKEPIAMGLTAMYRVAQSIFNKAGIPERYILYSCYPEISNGSKHLQKQKSNILKRKEGVAVLIGDNGSSLFELDPSEENNRIMLDFYKKQEKVQQKVLKINGNIAYPGKIKGVVKIITNLAVHSKKFRSGDILVTGMTRPEFIHLMKRASAVITDEGGITSHAAIVSREMKIPCIIGTKIATHILKDGDLIEVDANNGIIKILERETQKEKSTDYIRMFELPGLPFLMTSIALDYYKPLKAMAMLRDNLWTSLLPKESEKKTLKEGIKLFGNKKLFDKYRKEFGNYKIRSIKFFETTLKKNNISRSDIKKYLDLISEQWKHYQKTEFFYVDDAYKKSQKDKTTTNNLKHLEEIKNSGREHLNKLIFGNQSYLSKILVKISKQFNIPVDDLLFYSKEEIYGLSDGNKTDDSILTGRKESYVFFIKGKELIILQGSDAKKFISEFIAESTSNEIKGTPVNKGVVKGRAKVLFYSSDKFDEVSKMIKEMKKGDILIAETTSPELMAACKKASAILTNQGGLLSHAAIVSRELGIPCIVGLENITHIVKDGDLLEVDGDKGIVKILKK